MNEEGARLGGAKDTSACIRLGGITFSDPAAQERDRRWLRDLRRTVGRHSETQGRYADTADAARRRSEAGASRHSGGEASEEMKSGEITTHQVPKPEWLQARRRAGSYRAERRRLWRHRSRAQHEHSDH